MDTAGTDAADRIRDEVRQWLAANWARDITVREWWRRLAEARLTAPGWPEPYGRGYPASAARVVTRELAQAGAVAPPAGAVALRLAGPTLLEHGTDAQRDAYLPPMLRGEESWCQLFSEPGAGSDLPSLATRAVRDGDEFVVNGQKVWNSGADVARRGLLLARTDIGVPKREGITYFVLDMDQPGILARPLRQMDGQASFCEVFITDARVRAADILGEPNRGWDVTRTTLLYERMSATERAARGLVFVASGEKAGQLDRLVGDVLATRTGPRRRFTGSAVPARDLIELAHERGVSGDPLVRQRLARYYSMTEVHRITQLRARSSAGAGRTPGPEGSISKLALGEICRTSRDLSFAILGADTMLSGGDALYGGEFQAVGLGSPGVTIGAGTDEIQRNTLGERVLGLPHEPASDRGVPFEDLLVGTQKRP
jgi:alkylation response protein AidB-like acyl-CoA dehydrogenase